MGLDRSGISFLLHAKSRGVDFSRTLTIGRQGLHLTAADLEGVLREFGRPADPDAVGDMFRKSGGFAEAFLASLGAQGPESLDFSAYEQATHIHDLNTPVPAELRERYSVVLDGGSLEHVFNFPVAVRGCMEMVRSGGHFLGITPANNFMGHGFYQFSPELVYGVFSDDNGFEVEDLLLYDVFREQWFHVANPADVRCRVGVVTDASTYLMVIARRKRVERVFSRWPQQSDYVAVWKTGKAKDYPGRGDSPKGLRRLAGWLPHGVKRVLKRCVSRFSPRAPFYDPAFFRSIDISRQRGGGKNQ